MSSASLDQHPSRPANTPATAPIAAVHHPADTPQTPVFAVEDDPTLTTSQLMVAGALAGITEHTAMYPIDTIKTRMQSYVALRSVHSRIIPVVRSIVATEGVAALWRGIPAVIISAGPAHALSFATYETVRKILAPQVATDGDVHPFATATAGVCATVVGDGIMTPMDVVKQRMQLQAGTVYSGVVACMKRTYGNQGFRAFYAGYGATLVMNVPFTATYFCGYETAKNLILTWRSKSEAQFSAPSHCVAGGLAGGLAGVVTNPLDVVKTRLQTQGEIGARRYAGMADACRRIWMEEGVGGFMRGVRARVLFHVPAAAVCWTTYEFCKHILKGQNVRADRVVHG